MRTVEANGDGLFHIGFLPYLVQRQPWREGAVYRLLGVTLSFPSLTSLFILFLPLLQ